MMSRRFFSWLQKLNDSKRANLVLLFLFITRIMANCLIPINDTTEARYTELREKCLKLAIGLLR